MFSIFDQYRGLRKELYILFFGKIVTNMGTMIWPMMTMILTQKMHLSASDTAIVLAIYNLVMLPSNMLGGKLADHYNKKMLIIYCDLLSILCFFTCGLISMSWTAIVLMSAGGILQGMERPAYTALLADITPTDKREQAYSLLYLGANMGLALSPTIGGLLFKNYLWLAFLINGAAIACSTTLIFFKIKNIQPVEETGSMSSYQEAKGDMGLWDVLKNNKPVLCYIIVEALFCVGYDQFNYLMPLDLGRVHGDQGAALFGTIVSSNCLIIIFFTPILTLIFARIAEIHRMVVAGLFQSIGFGIFLLFLGRIPVYYVAITLFTWGEVMATIATNPYLSKRVPASHRGRIEGFYSVLRAFLTALGQILIGNLYDLHGSKAAWLFAVGITFVSMAGLSSLYPWDKKRYNKLYEWVSRDGSF